MHTLERHPLYDEVASVIRRSNGGSAAYVERMFGISYEEADQIVGQLERDGVVTKPDLRGSRQLVKPSTQHQGLPVAGYTLQSEAAVEQVNLHKQLEERLLRVLDELKAYPGIDQRWLATGRTDIEKGFMAVNRAVFCPQRVELPEDEELA